MFGFGGGKSIKIGEKSVNLSEQKKFLLHIYLLPIYITEPENLKLVKTIKIGINDGINGNSQKMLVFSSQK